jgi:hypothetical protein
VFTVVVRGVQMHAVMKCMALVFSLLHFCKRSGQFAGTTLTYLASLQVSTTVRLRRCACRRRRSEGVCIQTHPVLKQASVLYFCTRKRCLSVLRMTPHFTPSVVAGVYGSVLSDGAQARPSIFSRVHTLVRDPCVSRASSTDIPSPPPRRCSAAG